MEKYKERLEELLRLANGEQYVLQYKLDELVREA